MLVRVVLHTAGAMAKVVESQQAGPCVRSGMDNYRNGPNGASGRPLGTNG